MSPVWKGLEKSKFFQKRRTPFSFPASSSPKKLTDYAYLFVVKEFSINQFQVNQNRERNDKIVNILIDHWT
jgi:hypothetical protein